MIYSFDTNNEHAATAALIVYACYKSRDTAKFKVSPDMWGIIERSCKACSKRASTLKDFIEKFKVKVQCSTINPKYTSSNLSSEIIIRTDDGFITKKNSRSREFWCSLIEDADNEKVLSELYNHTAFTIVLVRERLEREKELEKMEKKENKGEES